MAGRRLTQGETLREKTYQNGMPVIEVRTVGDVVQTEASEWSRMFPEFFEVPLVVIQISQMLGHLVRIRVNAEIDDRCDASYLSLQAAANHRCRQRCANHHWTP